MGFIYKIKKKYLGMGFILRNIVSLLREGASGGTVGSPE
jgi:hypothetical protein